MRVIWKDSGQTKGHKPVKYRDHMIFGSPEGWTTNIPGDNNIYKTHYCALNAIDKALGGKTRIDNPKRHSRGITIVGRKSGDHSCA